MPQPRNCPECGTSLPSDAPGGLCPKCLLGAGIDATAEYRPVRPPTPAPAPQAAIGNFESFRATLLELGIVQPADLDGLAAEASGDVGQLVRALLRARKLTPYQAGALEQGKAKGLLIGRYIVLDKLGVGGMGVVFRARHQQTGQVVALKILPPSFAREKEAVRRFRREFQIAAHLNHPNLVAAIEASEDRGVHFLTMDYIAGRDLEALVRDTGPLAVKLALHCVIQVARGLEAAHAQGVVHRDIKPSNVMIDAAGNVRVLDLGLARILEAAGPLGQDSTRSITQTGAYMGSVDFLAPEQAHDAKKADHRADIYSLGCTLFFLLTGRPPFPEDSILKRLIAHQERPAPSLADARPNVPPALAEIYEQMMAKRPEDRPQSMTDVIVALEDCRSSPREAGDASNDLKHFATTFFKRAVPRRPGQESSLLGRPHEADGLQLGSDLRFEDVVADYREETEQEPLDEDKLPPPLPRLKPTRRIGRVRRGAWPLAMTGLLGTLGISGWLATRTSRPKPEPLVSNAEATIDSATRPAAVVPKPIDDGWRPLFNGKNFDEWVFYDGTSADWTVENGTITLTDLPRTTKKASFLATKKSFDDFELRLEFHASDRANGGFALMTIEPDGTSKNCAEIVDFQGSRTLNLWMWGDGGNFRMVKVPPVSYDRAREWQTLEVVRRDGKVTTRINGQTALDAFDQIKGSRRIALQGIRAPLRFRKIEIRERKPDDESSTSDASSLLAATEAARDGSVIYLDEFNDARTGFPVGEVKVPGGDTPFRRGYQDGAYFLAAPPKYTGFEAWNTTEPIDLEFQVEAVGRTIGPPNAYAAWALIIVGPEGRGFQVSINPGGLLAVYPSPWGAEKFPNDPRLLEPTPHPAILGGSQWNTLRLTVRRRQVEVAVNGTRIGEPIRLEWDILPAVPEIAIVKGDANRIRAEINRLEVRTLDRGGTFPVDEAGRVLNLGFEDGTLRDWTALGGAFEGQPVAGDTIHTRRIQEFSNHTGRYWLGGFERFGDSRIGALTSAPFRLTAPYASFLLGGGKGSATRVEVALADGGRVIAQASGLDQESMGLVVADLSDYVGQRVVVRVIDNTREGWGHVNFDDFRLHAEKPRFGRLATKP